MAHAEHVHDGPSKATEKGRPRASCCGPAPSDDPGAPVIEAALVVVCALGTAAGFAMKLWWEPPDASPWWWVAMGVSFLAGGVRPVLGVIDNLRERKLSVDLLMLLAALGAAGLGDWVEGGVLLFLFALSGMLERYAMYSTRRSIDALMQLRPREASRVVDDVETLVPIDSLAVGDVVRVRPGERYPVDGEVTAGETWADQSTLTGESAPVEKAPGAVVYAGTINGTGSVLVRALTAAEDTTLQRIIHLVQEAQAEQTPVQRFVERWQGPYVVAVLGASAFTFLGTWLLHSPTDAGDAFYHAMVLLVAASPCAVVASVPAVMLSAIARAALGGVLCKGGVHLEALGEVDVLALDKTGTLTQGQPRVARIEPVGDATPERLLQLAAAVAQASEHHLAQALLEEAARLNLALPPADEFEAHTGLGMHAHVEGGWVGVGRDDLFTSHRVELPAAAVSAADALRREGWTALLVVAPRSGVAGVIAVADQPRPEARAALDALRRLGIERIVMLTGDHAAAAESVARQVGVDEVRAQLLPHDKVLAIQRLRTGGGVAMVGDGVNDAPALAAATVGIAMGGAGTDVALETADLVLMRDDLRALPFAVWLARTAQARVQQNLALALGVIALLVLSSFIGLPLWLGVIGHEGSTLLVVLNGVRLLWESPAEPHSS